MSARFLPRSRCDSVPAYFARLRSAARASRKRHSAGVKSISLRKLRFRRLKDMLGSSSSDAVALDRAGDTARAAAAATEFAARDGDHLDAVPTKVGVRGDVALVPDDHAGLDGEEVVAVVPLLALRRTDVLVRREHLHLVDAEGLPDGLEEVLVGD